MTEIASSMAKLDLSAGILEPAPPAAPQPPPAWPTVVDGEGDLYLTVGPEGRAFQVDSHALTRASKVWDRMLTGGWAESRPERGAWVVNWPEDHPRAMEILLPIVHQQHRSGAPQALGLDELFHVAVAVDVYDLPRCLGLCPKSWCEAVAPLLKDTLDLEALAKLSWIAWVFGDKVLFEGVLQRMMVETEVDEDGKLVDAATGTGLEDLSYLQAMDIHDHIAACRSQLISDLLGVPMGALTTTATTKAGASTFCRSNQLSSLRSDTARAKARRDCDVAIVGSLVHALAAEDLFPLPAGPGDVFESARALRARLASAAASIQTIGIPGGGGRDGGVAAAGSRSAAIQAGHVDSAFHARCSPSQKLLRQLGDVMAAARCGASPAHVRHLEQQAKEIRGSH